MTVGVIGVLLGLYDFIGGGCLSLGALSPRGEVPDVPFYTSGQQRAIEAYVEAAEVLDPINAAVGALVGLVGVLLVVAGALLFTGSEQRGLVGQVAFGASMAVDALQILWLVLWYGLLWDATVTYVEATVRTLPDAPVETGMVTAVSVGLVIALGTAYFAVKMALAGVGLWRCRLADGAADGVQQGPGGRSGPHAPTDDGLEWALDDEPGAASDALSGPVSSEEPRS